MSPNGSVTEIIFDMSPRSRVLFVDGHRPRRITFASRNLEPWGGRSQMSLLCHFALLIIMNCICVAMNWNGGKISRLNHFRLLSSYGQKVELLSFFRSNGIMAFA